MSAPQNLTRRLTSTLSTEAIVRSIRSREYPQDDLPPMMLARPANKAGEIHAISASGAACRRRRGHGRRMLCEWILAIKPATAIGDGTHDTSAHAQATRDLALRQCALVEQRIDFVDKRDWQHERGSVEE